MLKFWFLLIFVSEAVSLYTDEDIYNETFCDTKCYEGGHTLCQEPNQEKCVHYQEIPMTFGDPLFDTLINGHNGLRDRIAERINTVDMLELTWDYSLAKMAEQHLKRCIMPLQDPCALIPTIVPGDDVVDQFFKFNRSPVFIAQNSFSERASFFPHKFIERVIRVWYFEKDSMRPPTYQRTENINIGLLMGENNFTHIAFPYAHRFGCALAKSNGAYHVVCNYFPYYRTETNSMHFIRGAPTSRCPAYFPLPDKLYKNLCTHDDGAYWENCQTIKSLSHYILLALCLLYPLLAIY